MTKLENHAVLPRLTLAVGLTLAGLACGDEAPVDLDEDAGIGAADGGRPMRIIEPGTWRGSNLPSDPLLDLCFNINFGRDRFDTFDSRCVDPAGKDPTAPVAMYFFAQATTECPEGIELATTTEIRVSPATGLSYVGGNNYALRLTFVDEDQAEGTIEQRGTSCRVRWVAAATFE